MYPLTVAKPKRTQPRVLGDCKNVIDVVDVDPSAAILVKLLEGQGNDLLSIWVHWTTDSADELVELDETAAVKIKVAKELLDLTLGETEHVIGDGLSELVLVEGTRVVVVHDFELSLESNEASGTSGNKLLAESLGQFLWASVA